MHVEPRLAQALRSHPRGSCGLSMQDPVCEVPRTPLPGTSVHKGKNKGRGIVAAPALFLLLPWLYAESIALSISLASALTSFFICFFARLVASSTPRSMVSSPITIKAASLSSSISPTSLRSELDIPPRRWPMSAPAPAPRQPADQDRRRTDQADRRADGQPRPTAVLGGLLYLVNYLDLALFVLGE